MDALVKGFFGFIYEFATLGTNWFKRKKDWACQIKADPVP